MGLETRKRIAELYKNGRWNKDDLVAKQWAEDFFPVEKPKPKPKLKDKEEVKEEQKD